MRLKKLILTNLPYVLIGLACTNLGEAWRMAEGGDASEKLLSLISTIPAAFGNPLPSFNAFDLCVGLICGLMLRLAVYLRGKNAKKYRHNVEYGAARFGTAEDIRPYIDPKFQNNVILTQTERLTMNSRPKNAKTARNKNVLIVGGSGSGKTRFFIKPNLMQLHSSYVVTDPKGQLVLETGRLLERAGYKISVLNTINFKKSMHYVRLTWDKDSRYCVDGILCRTPEELFDILLSDFQDFAMICRTRGRREVTEADEKAVEELCQPYLDWRKEALK